MQSCEETIGLIVLKFFRQRQRRGSINNLSPSITAALLLMRLYLKDAQPLAGVFDLLIKVSHFFLPYSLG
jgi:hypothetical protein